MAIYCKLGVVRDGLFVAFVIVWAITRMTFFPLWYIRSVQLSLASCLINAQPLPAHRHAADDNSVIGCTGHDLTDDWLLASTHFVDSLCLF